MFGTTHLHVSRTNTCLIMSDQFEEERLERCSKINTLPFILPQWPWASALPPRMGCSHLRRLRYFGHVFCLLFGCVADICREYLRILRDTSVCSSLQFSSIVSACRKLHIDLQTKPIHIMHVHDSSISTMDGHRKYILSSYQMKAHI